jgi:hypothetical protein
MIEQKIWGKICVSRISWFVSCVNLDFDRGRVRHALSTPFYRFHLCTFCFKLPPEHHSMTMAAPNWLRGLVNSSQFFTPCGKCSHSHTAREATLNYWDLEQEQELCSICLLDPTPREVLQVRRSMRGNAPGTASLLPQRRFGFASHPECVCNVPNSHISHIILGCIAGPSFILPRRRQSGRCLKVGGHFRHPILCHQRIQGRLPSTETAAASTQRRPRRLPMHHLFTPSPGCFRVLLPPMQA